MIPTYSHKALWAGFIAYGVASVALVACGGDEEGPGAGGTGGVDAGQGGTGGTGAQGGGPTGGTGAVGTGGVTGGSGGTVDAGTDASLDSGIGGMADASEDAALDVNLEAGEAGKPCPGELVNVTGEGTASATSSYAAESVDNGIDGVSTTSWWVAATFDTETYTFTLPADECIGQIQVANTSTDPFNNWTGWGFDQVIVRVRNGDGDLIDERTVSLAGEPDPAVDINYVTLGLAVQGRTVELEFSGFLHNYGGFSDLTVSAIRVPPPPTDGAAPGQGGPP